MFCKKTKDSGPYHERLNSLQKTIEVLRTKVKKRTFKSRSKELRDYLSKKRSASEESGKTIELEGGIIIKVPQDVPQNGLRIPYYPSTDSSVPLFVSKSAAAFLTKLKEDIKEPKIIFPKNYKHRAVINRVFTPKGGTEQRTEIGHVYRQPPPNHHKIRKSAPFGCFLEVSKQHDGIDLFILYPQTPYLPIVREAQNQGERLRQFRWFKEMRKVSRRADTNKHNTSGNRETTANAEGGER